MQNSQEYFSLDFIKEEPQDMFSLPTEGVSDQMGFMRTANQSPDFLEDPLRLGSDCSGVKRAKITVNVKNCARARKRKNEEVSGKYSEPKTASGSRNLYISRTKQQLLIHKKTDVITLTPAEITSRISKRRGAPDNQHSKTELLFSCIKCFSKFKCKLAMDIHECTGGGSHSNEPLGEEEFVADKVKRRKMSSSDRGKIVSPDRKQNEGHFSSEELGDSEVPVPEYTSERPRKKSHRKIQKQRPNKSNTSDITSNVKIVKPDRNPKTSSKAKTLKNLGRGKRNILGAGSPSKLYKCFECNDIFKRTEEREAHMKSSHPEIQASFKCEECSKEFYVCQALASHKRTTHMADKIYSCQYENCEEKFHSKVTLSAHEKTHSISKDKPAYICQFCSKGFPTILQLEKHERQAAHTEDRSFKCPHCSKGFKKSRSLNIHIKAHSVSATRETKLCKECGKAFSSEAAVRIHEQRHIRPFNCDLCDKSYTTKILLDDHVNIHTGERPYKCNVCDKSFSRQTDLRNHERNVHGLPVEGNYKCHCGKVFMLSAQLINHQRTHSGEKPFSCDQCGKNFTQKAHLVHHQKTLHSDVPRETYKRSGVKDFPCPNCNKKFVSFEAVRQHEERIHSPRKELPFLCTLCGKGFQRSYFLEVHMRIHTGDKPFTCTMCQTSFRSKESLGIHIKKVHHNDTERGAFRYNEISDSEEF